MMTENRDYRADIARARAAAAILRGVALIAVIVGIGAFAAIAALLVVGYLEFEEGIDALVLIAFGSILGGAASFSSSWGLTLNADRTEMALPAQGSEDRGESAQDDSEEDDKRDH